ncbi:MAG: holo-[acyl-carrier protein] synthase [Dasania sp.]|jgi:holo-[acyl-carrier protein] synthase
MAPNLSLNFMQNISHDQSYIVGIGSDLCDVNRIRDLYHKFDDKFLQRIFSNAERTYFSTISAKQQVAFLAKRFAAKEAISKAFGTGIGKNAFFTDITCLNMLNKAPYIRLTGRAHQTALNLVQKNNFSKYHIYISLSDENQYALAFSILVGIK